MAGLTDQGLETKTVDEILAGMGQKQRDQIHPGLDTSAASIVGQLNGVVAAEAAEGWDALRAVYASKYPKSAGGTSLDNVCSLTGTKRRAATKTRVPGVLWTVDAGFSAGPGELVASVTGDTTRRFTNVTAIANAGGSPAAIVADADAETAGAVPCFAGQLTVIAEPVTGWTAVTNPNDGAEGLEIDTDPILRRRRVDELAGGSTTADAIRGAILRDTTLGVLFCRVLINEGNVTDANGLPANSIEVIAYGPESPSDDDNAALVAKIKALKGGAIRAVGTSSSAYTDDQGNVFTIGYTRPAKRAVYLSIDIKISAKTFPADGDEQVKSALVDVGDGVYQPGDPAIAERIKAAAFVVSGVTDVPALRLDFTASPTATANLVVGVREIADLDTSRVDVNHV